MNKPPEEWTCMSASVLRGYLGQVIGATPSIAEGAFFELLMQISLGTGYLLISLFEFKSREQREFALVLCVFLLEIAGKISFIVILGLGFVPDWTSDDWHECRENPDYWLLETTRWAV